MTVKIRFKQPKDNLKVI